MDILMLYIIVGVLWAVFCVRMQLKLRGLQSWLLLIVVFILNFLVWPISMLKAIHNCPIE